MDTGSADLWVPSSDCMLPGCAKHIRFNPSTSVTASSTGAPFTIKYGSGSVGGYVFRYTIEFAGFDIQNQGLGTVVEQSKAFSNEPFDGILGLGFNSLSALGAKTPLDHLMEQGRIKQKRFSLFLDRQGGRPSELLIDGVNPDYYQGNMTTLPLSSNLGYWMVKMDAVQITYNLGPITKIAMLYFTADQAIMDSGTTLIIGPKKAVKELHKYIPGARRANIFSQIYIFPCASVANLTLSFVFGNVPFEMSRDNLVMGTTDGGKTCVSAIQGSQTQEWIMGGSFLRNVYSVWDADQKTVSLARVRRA